MFKLIFAITLLGFTITSQEAFAIQIIHNSKNSRNQNEINELNRREEQQELFRQQVRIQQEMLDLQRHQNYFRR